MKVEEKCENSVEKFLKKRTGGNIFPRKSLWLFFLQRAVEVVAQPKQDFDHLIRDILVEVGTDFIQHVPHEVEVLPVCRFSRFRETYVNHTTVFRGIFAVEEALFHQYVHRCGQRCRREMQLARDFGHRAAGIRLQTRDGFDHVQFSAVEIG